MLGSGVAQRKRGGLITRRSVDQNHSPLISFCFLFVFLIMELTSKKKNTSTKHETQHHHAQHKHNTRQKYKNKVSLNKLYPVVNSNMFPKPKTCRLFVKFLLLLFDSPPLLFETSRTHTTLFITFHALVVIAALRVFSVLTLFKMSLFLEHFACQILSSLLCSSLWQTPRWRP